jgi:hypothetical protein
VNTTANAVMAASVGTPNRLATAGRSMV